MMKTVKFGQKNAQQIISEETINQIKSSVNNLCGFNLMEKMYYYVNEKNIHHLRGRNFKVCVNTFGQRYYLFLCNISGSKTCVFINKKKADMVSINMKFSDDLYRGTIIDGELVKDLSGNWVYSINDIYAYQGNPLLDGKYNLDKRCEILQTLLSKHYTKNINSDVCRMDQKEYFDYCYLQDLYDTYAPNMPYKCSGLIFQHIRENKSYIYIFPENRTDRKSVV